MRRRLSLPLLPCPSARRWRRRRHRTCMHRRARWRAPLRGTQRRTRRRRMTTVSSTSSFCRRRRRRRRLLGRQAAGRGTTFGAGCAVRRAASAPSPPHLLSARAHSAPSVGRSAGTSWPDLGVRAQLLRNARASRRAAKGARAGRWQVEMVGSRSVLRRAWSRPQRGGGARVRAVAKKGANWKASRRLATRFQ